eukprot:TRINITY_DN27725_c0_g1_i1.p1 TRINITY_DN27725_c0_g1~~TRINITY_DN27725_c0_g1_i1.p1  ORF type:complete len:771 (-),score=178.85 TRINITY_DN27725_c0_g1_i1:206-2398(-)
MSSFADDQHEELLRDAESTLISHRRRVAEDAHAKKVYRALADALAEADKAGRNYPFVEQAFNMCLEREFPKAMNISLQGQSGTQWKVSIDGHPPIFCSARVQVLGDDPELKSILTQRASLVRDVLKQNDWRTRLRENSCSFEEFVTELQTRWESCGGSYFSYASDTGNRWVEKGSLCPCCGRRKDENLLEGRHFCKVLAYYRCPDCSGQWSSFNARLDPDNQNVSLQRCMQCRSLGKVERFNVDVGSREREQGLWNYWKGGSESGRGGGMHKSDLCEACQRYGSCMGIFLDPFILKAALCLHTSTMVRWQPYSADVPELLVARYPCFSQTAQTMQVCIQPHVQTAAAARASQMLWAPVGVSLPSAAPGASAASSSSGARMAPPPKAYPMAAPASSSAASGGRGYASSGHPRPPAAAAAACAGADAAAGGSSAPSAASRAARPTSNAALERFLQNRVDQSRPAGSGGATQSGSGQSPGWQPSLRKGAAPHPPKAFPAQTPPPRALPPKAVPAELQAKAQVISDSLALQRTVTEVAAMVAKSQTQTPPPRRAKAPPMGHVPPSSTASQRDVSQPSQPSQQDDEQDFWQSAAVADRSRRQGAGHANLRGLGKGRGAQGSQESEDPFEGPMSQESDWVIEGAPTWPATRSGSASEAEDAAAQATGPSRSELAQSFPELSVLTHEELRRLVDVAKRVAARSCVAEGDPYRLAEDVLCVHGTFEGALQELTDALDE